MPRKRLARAGHARRHAPAAFAVLCACAASARAEPPALATLEYQIAPGLSGGCPDLEDFSASVARQLGYDPFGPSAERRVVVAIAPAKHGFEAAIKWSDSSGRWAGERRLQSQGSACDEIAANVAFAVAVQIQLLATLAPTGKNANAASSTPSASAPSESGAASTSNATTPKVSTQNSNTPSANTQNANAPNSDSNPAGSTHDAQAEEPEGRRKRFGLSLGLGPSLALGLAPHATGIGRLFGRYRLDWLSLELAVDAALPVSRTEADGSGFSLRRFAAGSAACAHIELFATCLTGTLGRLEARGFGVDKRASPAGLFVQVGVRLTATYEFGSRYFVGARLEGLMMPATWSVRLNDRIVWTTPRAAGLVGLDWGLNFF